MADGWDPQQYERFSRGAQRAVLRPRRAGRAAGARGPGGRPRLRHRRADRVARRPVAAVRARSGSTRRRRCWPRPRRSPGGPLRFVEGDLADPPLEGPFDVIVSNAALQWVPDHAEVLARWTALLAPGGQLAVQVPANVGHPAHVAADEVAHEPPFFDALGGDVPPDTVHTVAPPEPYASRARRARLLPAARAPAGLRPPPRRPPRTWSSGRRARSLTRFRTRMEPARYDEFVDRYRQPRARGPRRPRSVLLRLPAHPSLGSDGRPEPHRPEWGGGDRPGTVGGPPGRGGASVRRAAPALGRARGRRVGAPARRRADALDDPVARRVPDLRRGRGRVPRCTDVDGHTYVDFCLGDTGRHDRPRRCRRWPTPSPARPAAGVTTMLPDGRRPLGRRGAAPPLRPAASGRWR